MIRPARPAGAAVAVPPTAPKQPPTPPAAPPPAERTAKEFLAEANPFEGRFGFRAIVPASAMRIGIYGPGGIGKTSLASRAPGPVAIFDFDNSLPVLLPSLAGLDVRPVDGVQTWADLREALAEEKIWSPIKTIVIDSLTKCETLAVADTVKNIRHEKGHAVTSVEGYGFAKGYRHVAETFAPLLGDLDRHVAAGRNVILIMHECTATVPNPDGDDYIRWEPRLQNQNTGNLRLIVKEWLDHLLCLRYDLAVNKDKGEKKGKASGGETRTIYPIESGVHMAKSRSLKFPIEFKENGRELWQQLFEEKK